MFGRTFHSVESESEGRSKVVLLVTLPLIAVWLAWFVFMPVAVYETTSAARLEVSQAKHAADVQVDGRVVDVRALSLGRHVVAGEILVELDAEPQRRELEEARARVASLGREVVAAREQAEAEAEALETELRQIPLSAAQARGRRDESAVLARASRVEADRTQRLHEAGLVSVAEAYAANAEAERRAIVLNTRALDIEQSVVEALLRVHERRIRIAGMHREAERLDAQHVIESAHVATLEHEVERRRIRSAGAGRIGAVGPIYLGATLKAGDRVATVLADDALCLVAEMSPAGAFGRVQPGQEATVKFDGFSSLDYSGVRATVRRVAGELRDGHARVELEIDSTTASRIPMQHGLPASVAIRVERATPLRLVVRAAGRALARAVEAGSSNANK